MRKNKRNGRKEVTTIQFQGVTADGGFVFKATVSIANMGNSCTTLKVMSYKRGIMEIAIDYKESIKKVVEVISGMFSKYSNCSNLDAINLNYKNLCLKVKKGTGKKNLISMIMKEMSMPKYKKSNNDISIDFQTCQKQIIKDNSQFKAILETKSLWFKNIGIIIPSFKDGIVTINPIAGEDIYSFTAKLRKVFFNKYSKFYGVKEIKVKFNEVVMSVDSVSIDKMLHVYFSLV